MKLTAYSVKLKKVVEIANPKIVTMKNGRKAVQGVAADLEYLATKMLLKLKSK